MNLSSKEKKSLSSNWKDGGVINNQRSTGILPPVRYGSVICGNVIVLCRQVQNIELPVSILITRINDDTNSSNDNNINSSSIKPYCDDNSKNKLIILITSVDKLATRKHKENNNLYPTR